jgi:hypothetical protein
MLKKYKVPCPNCHAYALWSSSPAGLALTLLLGSVIIACIPIIGWLLLIPIAFLDIILLPATIVLYLIPKMRIVTVRCRQCEWKGHPTSLATAQLKIVA